MFHTSQGKSTMQAHKGIPEGFYEEEQGLKGFFGPVSHLIRKQPSTRWTHIEGNLKPRLFDLVKLTEGERRLFFNSTMTVLSSWFEPKPVSELFGLRNGDGDLLLFCHKGEGEIFTEYGILKYRPGTYVVIPKCLTYAVFPSTRTHFLTVESLSSHYEQPERGLVGRHAIYDMNALGVPNLEEQEQRLKELGAKLVTIQVKHLQTKTVFTYADCVLDVVGWKGDLFPFTLSMHHMMPLMSHRAHLPPSAHTTFVARDFVVCSFLPRPLEQDQDALKVPFYHQNIDYDEILFYHDGNFFSRDNLHAGMLSFHPAGFPHGPHPKAVKNIGNKTATDEYAVMIDSRWPLERDSIMDSIEIPEYWKSWMAKP